ncbi:MULTISPECIES: LysR family transcriptional regulator [Vibrio]|uniref:LysR family transcriptional regulator n=8 Tax=Vibrio harveyi TaxID=669 RepID=A0ABM5Y6L1_VIBHA|nr:MULTISPECIES: LysR family transcriptional regulator [Vibrio]AIV09039.1 LysR family transcriptional regulator [Vibrio harveyi]AMG01423.1 LysR family transcriptional regulator [Vibrio harveyi]APP09029.1 LysR family transcriptional regulator [Vibrio harveyi]AWB03041.1 LysR family transcriptional regulator [Vibrio harveyi]EKM17585.1 bacterial regulatory helix-turn-helix, lysR family protein [Vibrio harveyi]
MAKDLFSTLDLNLLRTFIILHQERNMRRAAERLFVSQPAVSKALQRLRDHFEDELFVKTHHGLRATEYANDLAESLAPLLDDISITINGSKAFNPLEMNGTVKIALAPFILSSYASEIFQAIRQAAPHVQIHLLNWSRSTMEEIIKDEVVLGVNYEINHAPKELLTKMIVKDEFCAYVRKDHPLQGHRLQISDCNDLEFATVIAADWNSNISFSEKIMKIKGVEPKIAFRSELPSAIIDVVANSDMVFPASKTVNVDKLYKLRRLDIELDGMVIEPCLHAYFHHKNRRNETVHWLRNIVTEVIISHLERPQEQ